MRDTELDITDFFNGAAPCDYSANAMELGQDAARITWRNACADSAEWPLLQTAEQRDAFRGFVGGFGAWDDAEIAAWSDTELNALCIQFVSGDIRESGLTAGASDADWKAYEGDASEGRVCGRICRGTDGRVYFYIGE